LGRLPSIGSGRLIDAVTAADIQRVARKHLDPRRRTPAVVADLTETELKPSSPQGIHPFRSISGGRIPFGVSGKVSERPE
jgi:hypothetical protein